MKSRKLFLMVILAAAVLTCAIAQPRMGRGDRTEAQLKRIIEKVGLSTEQSIKVKEVILKAREEARAEFDKNDGDRESMREIMKKRTEKTDAEILKLLTKEQKPKYEEYKKERQKEMEERMRERQ
ncbi:MAG: hypothetical protein WDA22_13475 [Bacteroidota bacterium]